MTRSKYSRSVAKFIRKQKATIRRTVKTKEEQDKLIAELIAQVDQQK
jgi:histidinol-phosphate/aromatic aminotransferase/cobyric acid decarboxylase-like protein